MGRVPVELAVWADIRAFPPLAVIAGLDCLAGLVLWRKNGGGPTLVLTNVRLCLAALAVTSLIVAGRWWLARIERESPAVWIRSALMVFAVLPMLALLSLANPGHSHWAVGVTSALAVVSGGAALLWKRRSPSHCEMDRTPSPQPTTHSIPAISVGAAWPTNAARAVPAAARGDVVGTARLTGAEAARAEPDEWTERTVDETGAVKLQGRVAAEFAPGQSVGTAHIPFCPPFARVPEFTFQVEGDPSVRPRTPAVHWYGARVELKRAGDTSRPARVVIRFQACADANSSRAA